jgi:hypothetical protein
MFLGRRQKGVTILSYKIDWIGTVAIGVQTEGGRELAFSLEEGQHVPKGFKVGDDVQIVNQPAHPASIDMGLDWGYYEITHCRSGKVLKTWHRDGAFQVK